MMAQFIICCVATFRQCAHALIISDAVSVVHHSVSHVNSCHIFSHLYSCASAYAGSVLAVRCVYFSVVFQLCFQTIICNCQNMMCEHSNTYRSEHNCERDSTYYITTTKSSADAPHDCVSCIRHTYPLRCNRIWRGNLHAPPTR